MRRRAIIGALLLIVVAVALLAATATNAAEDQEIKVKLALSPCFPIGQDDAGGEVEWESDTQILKVELWGATDLGGRTLDVFVGVLRDGMRVRLLVGSLTIDRAGDATWLLPTDTPIVDFEVGDPAEPIGPIFSSDRALC